MGKQAKVLFAHEVEGKAYLTDFVTHNGGSFSTVFVDEQLQVIVKEVKAKKQSLDKVRMIAGDVSKQLKKLHVNKATVDDGALVKAFDSFDKDGLVTAFVEGWHLGAYEFDAYKSKKAKEKALLNFVNEAEVESAVSFGEIRAASMAFSRDLMNEPGATLNPEAYPEVLQKEFEGSNVDVVVHDKKALESMKMNGILTVNRGSKHDPAFVELHYQGDESKPLVTLVGKGVTFDTGGISLKSGRNISDMRMDMGGSAAVAGAMKLLADSNAPVNVVGLIQIVENMPDRHSFLPGDVIEYKNGKTVQIGNTDAEGRLILADGLIRAGELKAEYIVDIATLTGAVVAALGTKVAGIFGEDELTSVMKKVGDDNGDFVWPLPLVEEYDATLKTDYADFSNVSNQAHGGSITAALFLRRFVPESAKWVHVDMAGTMEAKNKGYYHQEGSGFGARLLADYAVEVSQ